MTFNCRLQGDRVGALLLALALFLMMAGSLRRIVTPAGYWVAWCIWGLLIITVWRRELIRSICSVPAPISASFVLLFLGMTISGVVNNDWISVYQACKVAVIGLLFVAMWQLALVVTWEDLVCSTVWAIGLIAMSFLITKMWAPAFSGQAISDGQREGSFLAVHGVLWKVGAFSLPLFLANMVVAPKSWIMNLFLISVCVFFVVIDGSRTGLLLVGSIFVGFFVFHVVRNRLKALKRIFLWVLIFPVISLGLQFLNSSVDFAGTEFRQSISEGDAIDAVNSDSFVDKALRPILQSRFRSGDPSRIVLMQDGVRIAKDCQPFGCGFKSTVGDIGTGSLMATHNAYIAALGDFGILGLLGMLGFLVAAWLPIWRVLRNDQGVEQSYFAVATAGSALAYGMSLMLNTFTTEMSEWGYLILMLAFAWTPARAA